MKKTKILNPYKTFAKNLKILRDSLGLTQDEMSKKLHVTKQTVFRYEKGKASPSLGVLLHLAMDYNVNLNWLLNEKCENEEMFLKDIPVDYAEFMEEVKELKFLFDNVPFVRSAILKNFILYKFEHKIEINQFLEKKGLS